MGGVLALEAARRLDAVPGQSFVGLLDSSPPGCEDESLCFALTTLLTVAFGIANPDVAALLEMSRDQRSAEVTRLGLASGALAEHDDPQRAERLLAMYQLNARALSRFVVTMYAGPVHLFRAVGSAGSATDREWIDVIPELSVHDVPGDHVSMMEPGNVETMAMAIDDCLERWAVRRAGR
jgi:thioesterase domain-containing protein